MLAYDSMCLTEGFLVERHVAIIGRRGYPSHHGGLKQPFVRSLPTWSIAGIPTVVNVDSLEWDRAKWGPVAKADFRTEARLVAKHATSIVYDQCLYTSVTSRT